MPIYDRLAGRDFSRPAFGVSPGKFLCAMSVSKALIWRIRNALSRFSNEEGNPMTTFHSASRRALAFLLSAILGASAIIACLAVPGVAPAAYAVINRGTVSVSVPGSVSLTAGESTSVACTVSPAVDQQTPNCTTDYCPSGCDFASVGCQDANGQCTCIGTYYSPYYSDATVSSSNPSVARASYNNGVLYIDGYSAGTATITVYGSLRLWTTGIAYVTVNVSAAQQVSPTPSSSPTPSDSGSGSSSGSVSVSQSGITASSSTAHVLSALVAGGNTAKVEEGAEAEIEEVQLAKIGEANPAEALGEIAGSSKTVCFWYGDSLESADYLWSFAGGDVSAEAAASAADFDFGVSNAAGANDELDSYLDGKKSVAIKFASDKFPASSTFAYRVNDTFANGDRVHMYYFDERANSLVLVQENIEVAEGYVAAKLDHGGVWVLSDDATLAGSLAKQVEKSETEDQKAEKETSANDDSTEAVPAAAIAVGAVVVVVVVGGIAYAVFRSRKSAMPAEGVVEAQIPEESADAEERG